MICKTVTRKRTLLIAQQVGSSRLWCTVRWGLHINERRNLRDRSASKFTYDYWLPAASSGLTAHVILRQLTSSVRSSVIFIEQRYSAGLPLRARLKLYITVYWPNYITRSISQGLCNIWSWHGKRCMIDRRTVRSILRARLSCQSKGLPQLRIRIWHGCLSVLIRQLCHITSSSFVIQARINI